MCNTCCDAGLKHRAGLRRIRLATKLHRAKGKAAGGGAIGTGEGLFHDPIVGTRA